jgi:hypothetical protein
MINILTTTLITTGRGMIKTVIEETIEMKIMTTEEDVTIEEVGVVMAEVEAVEVVMVEEANEVTITLIVFITKVRVRSIAGTSGENVS